MRSVNLIISSSNVIKERKDSKLTKTPFLWSGTYHVVQHCSYFQAGAEPFFFTFLAWNNCAHQRLVWRKCVRQSYLTWGKCQYLSVPAEICFRKLKPQLFKQAQVKKKTTFRIIIIIFKGIVQNPFWCDAVFQQSAAAARRYSLLSSCKHQGRPDGLIRQYVKYLVVVAATLQVCFGFKMRIFKPVVITQKVQVRPKSLQPSAPKWTLAPW